MRATYLGPLRPQTTYTAEEWTTADTIPLGEALVDYQFTYEQVASSKEAEDENDDGWIPSVDESEGNVAAGSKSARAAALVYAINHTIQTQEGDEGKNPVDKTKYDRTNRMSKMITVDGKEVFDYVDCSSLVVARVTPPSTLQRGWGGPPAPAR